MNNMFKSAAFLVLAGAASAYGQTFDTLSSWNGTQSISSFGYPNTATYGEVFTASGSALYNFTVEMKLPTTANSQGYLFAWDGTKATGSALFTSPVMATTDSSVFQAISFDVGGAPVTSGDKYVFFASTSEDSGSGQGQWGAIQNGGSYGGGFYYLNNGTDSTQWTSQAWSTSLSSRSAAFTADFAPTPEPTSLALAGLGGLALLLRKRK